MKARTSKVRDHTHTLKRTTYASSGTKIYFCIDDCSYKIEVAFALGKIVNCPICGNDFKMNEYSIKLAKPHCNSCGKMQIKDADGKRRFIAKGRPQQAIADIAKNSISDLTARLGRVVAMAKDEEI